jgi:hypothetical protein
MRIDLRAAARATQPVNAGKTKVDAFKPVTNDAKKNRSQER